MEKIRLKSFILFRAEFNNFFNALNSLLNTWMGLKQTYKTFSRIYSNIAAILSFSKRTNES